VELMTSFMRFILSEIFVIDDRLRIQNEQIELTQHKN
jgi:hypothetical protein